MKGKWLVCTSVAFVLTWGSAVAYGQNVKITPLGQRTGDFCARDRALLLEDPTGVRLLYDPGRTVAGGTDARLGEVHVILLSHAHSDHIGDVNLSQNPDDDTASCDLNFLSTSSAPYSTTAEIAAAKNSAVLAGRVSPFLSVRIGDLRGAPTPACPNSGDNNEMTVPRSSPCWGLLGYGGKRTVTMSPGTPGVQVAVVAAQHSNELDPVFLTDPEKTNLSANGLSAHVGPSQGFVLTFTNGLTMYLSGDTGPIADMATIVRGYYGSKLAVVNMGGLFTMGPEEAAFAVKHLIEPLAVIPSHANEVATNGGVVRPGTRTARFIDLLEGTPVYVPRSGITMEFDGDARCLAGCGGNVPNTTQRK